jgi:NADH:ubiquinone oxidoreductase subunit E
VCRNCKIGTCGLGQGVDIFEEIKQYEELLIEKGMEFSITECGCLGLCKGPVVRVNGRTYTEVDEDKVETILNELLS